MATPALMALVGTAGAVSTGAVDAAVTPSYGQSPTKGNMLLLPVASLGATTVPTTPSGGWTLIRSQAGATVVWAGLYMKIASGGDSTPTIAAIASSAVTAQLYEFNGNIQNNTFPNAVDHGSAGTTTTSPHTNTNSAPDAVPGELWFSFWAGLYSASATLASLAFTSNNISTSITQQDNHSTNTANHYAFAYGFTTSNSSATTSVLTFTTTNLTDGATGVETFKAGLLAVAEPRPAFPMRTAVNRAAHFFSRVPWHEKRPSGLIVPDLLVP